MNQNAKKRRVLVVHGPNLNMLGQRESGLYGTKTLPEVNNLLSEAANSLGIAVDTFQSNHEGDIITTVQKAAQKYDGLIINPAAYTHTSIGIRDALQILDMPVIEVHISNIYQRAPFRQKSMTAGVVTGQIAGLGIQGYLMALTALVELM